MSSSVSNENGCLMEISGQWQLQTKIVYSNIYNACMFVYIHMHIE